MMHTFGLVAALFTLAGTLAAQGRTWIVDQNNGPGTHFTDVPPAIAAATDGDFLVIRAGRYAAFATSKGVTLLGQGNVVVADAFLPGSSVVSVASLPAGRAFVMKNVRIESRWASTALSLASNLGRVHLENVEATTPSVPPANVTGCIVVDCTAVTFVRGRLYGFPALNAARSTLALTGTNVVGGSHCGSSRCLAGIGDGMAVADCSVLLAHTDITGGSTFPTFPGEPRPAIRATRSLLVLTGDPATTISAGGGMGTTPVPAIATDSGTIQLDTRLQVVGSQGGADIGGNAIVVRRRIVALSGSGGPPGGNVTAEIVSPAGDPLAFGLSLPIAPVPLPIGLLFVDPQYLALFGFGVQNGNERTISTVPVPADPWLRGLTIAVQAVSISSATQTLELSNPLVVVLD